MSRRHRATLRLGPGLLTGACNDDPASVGTYSQIGAQFGYALGWTLLFSLPLLVAVQEISARIARVTGLGLAGNLRRHCPRWLALTLILLLAAANMFNLAANLAAMGAVLRLVVAAPVLLYVCLLGAAAVLIERLTRNARDLRRLRWLSLSLLSYVVCAFLIEVPWRQVARALLWPSVSWTATYLLAVLAALGTTISPYLLFWQAQQEVETTLPADAPALRDAIEQAPEEFRRIRFDTFIGMGLSAVVALFIVITTASTLHTGGVRSIQDAAEAAEALRALGGRFTFGLFALGIIGAGLLALPALSTTTVYALGELLRRPAGRRHAPSRAQGFYLAIGGATVLAVGLNFTPLDPMRALYLSAVINGVICVPLVGAVVYLAGEQRVMGALRVPLALRLLGWLTVATLACSVAAAGTAWLVRR
ncbi:MAG: divalent metal cation transporter [Gammaproteobacteria bacterium]|nr:divalent metal cation transporter [Gammaproteobacteria bacterium]MBV9725532.1 divalent metal cation transporter [Gammaproteobacteria bacterium]